MRPNAELRALLEELRVGSFGSASPETLVDRALKLIPEFSQRVEFSKAEFNEQVGRASVEVFFTLQGPEGAINLRVLTGWWLPSCRMDVGAALANMKLIQAGYPAAMGMHSYTQRGDDWMPHLQCDALRGSECWSSAAGGFVLTERTFDVLIVEGEVAFWKAMRRIYDRTFAPVAVPA